MNYLDSLYSFEHRKGENASVDFAAGLERLRAFVKEVGLDFGGLRIVHVAGSKGKGAVCELLGEYLKSVGKTVGVFTSPHLFDVRERVKIGGEMIGVEEFEAAVEWLEGVEARERGISYFEALFVIAMKLFVEKGVEFAIVEVGLGGRFDATNIVSPEVCALTFLEKEHTNILGETLGEIANEKLGIKKENVPMYVGFQSDEGLKILKDRAEDLVFLNDISLSPQFASQQNEMLVFNLVKALLGEVDLKIFGEVTAEFKRPGRFELRDYDGKSVVFDVAHTPASVENLLRKLEDKFPDMKWVFLVSLMKDKKIQEILSLLESKAERIVFTVSHPERSFRFEGGYEDCKKAFSETLEGLNEDEVLITLGSHFLLGQL